MSLYLRLGLLAVLFLAGLWLGWMIKGWSIDSRDLAIEQAKTAFVNTYKELEGQSAIVLETKLASLKANERVIEREKIKIVNRDVYHNECLDNDGVLLIESARTGKTSTSKSVN